MTTPPARRKPNPVAVPREKSKAPAKTAGKRRILPAQDAPLPKDASPLNGVVPPVEHRFKPGNQAAVGYGRPRTMKELQELILETLAEETGDMTRARLLVRTMLVKSPSDRQTLLEYAFGKVPQVTRDLNDDEWREWLRQNGHDPDQLVAEFVAHMGDGRDSARSVPADAAKPGGE